MTLDLPDCFQRILDLLEAAEDEEQPETGPGPCLSRLLAESEALAEQAPGVADTHYIRGYALFLLSRQETAVAQEALEEMALAMRLRPGHHWARYHAIILCHEKGDHASVVHHFETLNRAYFARDGKDWRYLVAWQYAIDGLLRLGRADRFEGELTNLVRAYLDHIDDPDELLPRPGLLFNLNRDIRQGRLDVLPEAVARACAQFLEDRLALLIPGGWGRESDLSDGRAR
ncbi:hypothetical protein GCM10010140_76270 [Streptosporangium pseudovulgare]|uniref:Tetratricopeptide repeat protein n=2 Tax=Streptosporangium pseudovulgare TaxID=35765 RepID=A0ABQ2RK01_9ACTN|nr:hypothetical protein GCM10010140_76270 [Streptosporangium pseudovulgare]